jgi:trimeric autotransporter adhesin
MGSRTGIDNSLSIFGDNGASNTTSPQVEVVTILQDGKIGINSTAPTEKLDVVGTVKATDFNTTSDQNLKTNIQTIENPLDKIVQIRGVNFEWKENNKPSAGVIAQEVEKVLPQLVNGEGTKTVNYNGLIGLLIEAVKAQQEEINMLKERLK